MRDAARPIARATLIGAAETQTESPFGAVVSHYRSPGPARFIAIFAGG